MYLQILIAGFFGGVIRGLVGFLKHQRSYKNVPFRMLYFLGTCFLAGVIGLMAVAAVQAVGFSYGGTFTTALSFIIGYAGSDFLESVYKIIVKKSSL